MKTAVPRHDRDAVTVPGADDDHSELAWRLRHARRGILKTPAAESDLGGRRRSGRSVRRLAAARSDRRPALGDELFTDTPFSGQVNLLTTGMFDSPQQLFTADNFSRSIAYLASGAPVGDQADWTVRGALTQARHLVVDRRRAYATRAPARHRYDFGLSYSTQRYDGGNSLALRDVTDGSRNAGAIYGVRPFAVTPAVTLTYGGRYARYDYLDSRT